MEDPRPLLLTGTQREPYVERVPIMGGTRLHFVPQSVDGRSIVPSQRSKSGGRGRPAAKVLPSGQARCLSCWHIKAHPGEFLNAKGKPTVQTCSACIQRNTAR